MLEPVTPAESARPPRASAPVGTWQLTRPEQLGPLRRDVAQAVHRHSGDHDGLEDLTTRLVLVVSELATNALKYGAEPVTVGLARREGEWLVSVRDGDAERMPSQYPQDPTRIGGHGLEIVARLSTAWGWHRSEADTPRKCVWALVPFGVPSGRG